MGRLAYKRPSCPTIDSNRADIWGVALGRPSVKLALGKAPICRQSLQVSFKPFGPRLLLTPLRQEGK